jgi:hypothetical protein
MKNLKQNYVKFQIRGAIKEIMRNYGIRTISFKNYFDYLGITPTINDIHSLRYDIMNGYIKAYGYKKGDSLRRCGEPIESISNDEYKEIYNILENLITNTHKIPSKQKRNIIVKVNR